MKERRGKRGCGEQVTENGRRGHNRRGVYKIRRGRGGVERIQQESEVSKGGKDGRKGKDRKVENGRWKEMEHFTGELKRR